MEQSPQDKNSNIVSQAFSAVGNLFNKIDNMTYSFVAAAVKPFADKMNNSIGNGNPEPIAVEKPQWQKDKQAQLFAQEDAYQAEIAAQHAQHDQRMNEWDVLSEAVGGDLFENDAKLAIMRKVDAEMGQDVSWQDFHNRVVSEIEAQQPTNKTSMDIA